MFSETPSNSIKIEEFPLKKKLPADFLSLFEGYSSSIREFRDSPLNSNYYQIHRQHSYAAFENSLSEVVDRDQALVLGSGNLIEVPANRLLNDFNRVSFVDLDARSTKDALNKEPIEMCRKIGKLIREDITGSYADITNATADIIHSAANPELAIQAIVEYVTQYRPNTEPVAQALGRDKYDFVSSSLILSQLHIALIDFLIVKFKQKFGITLDVASAQPGSLSTKFFNSMGRFGLTLQVYHFELLAKLLKPQGILHFACTPEIRYFRRDYQGEITPIKNEQILHMGTVSSIINTSFWPITERQSSWGYLKCNPDFINPVGELYNAIALPCRLRIDEGGNKREDHAFLLSK